MNNGVTEIIISDGMITDAVWITDEQAGCSLEDFSVAFANVEDSTISRFDGNKNTITGLGYNGSMMSASSNDCTIWLWNTVSIEGKYIKAHTSEVNDHK